MRKDFSYRDFDWVLLGLVFAISAIGVLQIYSTTIHTKFAGAHTRQIYWILLGIVLLVIFSFWDYHNILNHAPTIYFVTLILLLVVLVLGTHIFGARRWIRVGGLSIQISEPMKLVLILLLARFFSDTPREGVSMQDVMKVAAVVAAPALLILLQPDLEQQ
jgi:rod shape determining protein RodA